MFLSLLSTSSVVHMRRWLFWAISRPETATPPQFEASVFLDQRRSQLQKNLLTSRSVPDTPWSGTAGSLEDFDGLGGAAHVGALGDDADTSLDKGLGLLT